MKIERLHVFKAVRLKQFKIPLRSIYKIFRNLHRARAGLGSQCHSKILLKNWFTLSTDRGASADCYFILNLFYEISQAKSVL